MWYRVQIVALVVVPLAILGGLVALHRTIPIPVLWRDYVLHVPLIETSVMKNPPRVEGPDDPSLPLVVIDPGHGGEDPGATGDGYEEKNLVLGLARALRNKLLAEGGIRVAMTRDSDRFLALSERVAIARKLKANLFISIHADSAGDDGKIKGASIYTLSDKASSQAAARFAERENSADEVNGTRLTDTSSKVDAILVNLAQRRTSAESADFEKLLLREGKGKLDFRPQPRRSAALAVLRAPDIPGVLFEAGYISNKQDAERLASAKGRQVFASVVAKAIRIYFARHSKAA